MIVSGNDTISDQILIVNVFKIADIISLDLNNSLKFFSPTHVLAEGL